MEFILYDISSRKILQQQFINAVTLNTEQLSAGIYNYELRSKSRIVKRGKIIKH